MSLEIKCDVLQKIVCRSRCFGVHVELLDMLITLKKSFLFKLAWFTLLQRCRYEQRRRQATAHKWQLHHCDSYSNGIFKMMHFIFQEKLDDNILFLSYCHLIFNMSLESQMVNYHNVLLGTFPS